MLVFSIVSLSPPPSAYLFYLPSLSVIFILSPLPFVFPPPPPPHPLPTSFSPISHFLSLSSLLLPFLLFNFFSLLFFLLFPLTSLYFLPFSLSLLFSFLSDLPPSLFVSLPPTSSSLLFIHLHLPTRYEQARKLLEMKKVSLLKIIASACSPPPTPVQAASSMKTVSNYGCAKRARGRNKQRDEDPKISTRDLSQIKALTMKPLTLLGRGVDGKISVYMHTLAKFQCIVALSMFN